MGGGIYVALSGAVAQETLLETTATNLANASTGGYQRLRPVFREVLAGAGRNGAPLHSAASGGTSLDSTPGAIRSTGRGLDVAFPPGTFLAVQTPRGERYTRAGAITVGTDGALLAGGMPVLGEDGTALRITPGGAEAGVAQDGAVSQADRPVGRLRLVSFTRPELLTPEGGTLLAGAPAAGAATPSRAPLSVGALEDSNATVVTAMNDLVTASRTFEAFQRVIDAFRDADHRVVSTVPSVT